MNVHVSYSTGEGAMCRVKQMNDCGRVDHMTFLEQGQFVNLFMIMIIRKKLKHDFSDKRYNKFRI